MGRPPCCDKAGIKKGPWTPEEDIILVSYIQEHGPGNWRSVPTNTGLARCSKSCRLRWTNYLRPGIKRGNFTPHEEGMIIHLQALLGNKWAAIASYLPQRTDNDIKNYWNTHLKKKLKKFQAALEPHHLVSSPSESTISSQFVSKSFYERPSLNMNSNHTSSLGLSQSSSSSTYASSTENISRLLQGWMAASPKPDTTLLRGTNKDTQLPNNDDNNNISNLENNKGVVKSASCGDMVSHEEFDSMLSFENLNSAAWDRTTDDSMAEQSSEVSADQKVVQDVVERNKPRSDLNTSAPPLSFLEKWLFEENVGHEEMMELSPMF